MGAMPNTIWKGTISFGLISIPVRVYAATENKDVSFNQVHAADNGRIRYKRTCDVCGQEVPFADIAKAYTAADGRVAVLDKSDLEDLPLPSVKGVEVIEFVDADQIDPMTLEKCYYLQAEGPGAKPYVLLRDALAGTGKLAVVKVALRQRESMAVLRPRGEVLVMHTLLWPDEVRDDAFAAPTGTITATDAEVSMARMFIEQLSGDYDPGQFADTYRTALEELVHAKLEGVPLPEGAEAPEAAGGEVVDLVAALKASVDAARKRREQAASTGPAPERAAG